MRKIPIYIFILFSIQGFGQEEDSVQVIYETRSLRIRKEVVDTVFYEKLIVTTELDTIRAKKINLNGFGRVQRKGVVYKIGRNDGHYNHWLFTSDSVYIYSKKISRRNRRRAKNNPEYFFQKMDEKVEKGKLLFYKTPYSYEINYSTQVFVKNKQKWICLINQETKDTIFNDRFAKDEIEREKGFEIIKYSFKTETDTIEGVLDSNYKRSEFDYVKDLYKYETVLNQVVTSIVNNRFKGMEFRGVFFCSKQVENKKYQLILNPENIIAKKLVFLDNRGKRYVCNYKIEKDSIFIENPPVSGFSKGKLIRKKGYKGKTDFQKEKIQFRLNKRRYVFSHKSENHNAQLDKMY